MTAPGVETQTIEPSIPTADPTDTDALFVAGPTWRGRTDEPIAVGSASDALRRLGGSIPEGLVYEELLGFFALGGERAYVGREVGPAAVAASVTVKDAGNLNTLRITAREVGETGNGWSYQFVDGDEPGSIRLRITDDNGTETSGDATTKADLVAWATEQSKLVDVVDVGTGVLPAVMADPANLAGGDADLATLSAGTLTAAFARLGPELGPGQASAPGRTTDAMHDVVIAHGLATNRVPVPHAPDVNDVATLTQLGTAHRTPAERDGARRGGVFASWWLLPGEQLGESIDVPPSAMVAGLCARNDLAGLPIAQAPAGEWGIAPEALGLTQPAYTVDERDTLNEASVNIARVINGQVRLYGFRSLTDPTTDRTWAMLTVARTVMKVTAIVRQLGESSEFALIDDEGHAAATFGSRIESTLRGLDDGKSLDDFSVATGVVVNNAGTRASRRLQAALKLTVAGTAETVAVTIEIDPVGG